MTRTTYCVHVPYIVYTYHTLCTRTIYCSHVPDKISLCPRSRPKCGVCDPRTPTKCLCQSASGQMIPPLCVQTTSSAEPDKYTINPSFFIIILRSSLSATLNYPSFFIIRRSQLSSIFHYPPLSIIRHYRYPIWNKKLSKNKRFVSNLLFRMIVFKFHLRKTYFYTEFFTIPQSFSKFQKLGDNILLLTRVGNFSSFRIFFRFCGSSPPACKLSLSDTGPAAQIFTMASHDPLTNYTTKHKTNFFGCFSPEMRFSQPNLP